MRLAWLLQTQCEKTIKENDAEANKAKQQLSALDKTIDEHRATITHLDTEIVTSPDRIQAQVAHLTQSKQQLQSEIDATAQAISETKARERRLAEIDACLKKLVKRMGVITTQQQAALAKDEELTKMNDVCKTAQTYYEDMREMRTQAAESLADVRLKVKNMKERHGAKLEQQQKLLRDLAAKRDEIGKQRVEKNSGAAMFNRKCAELKASMSAAVDSHDREVDKLMGMQAELECAVSC